MKTIRALVVEDSLTVRRRLVEVLSATDDIEVIAEAADGKRAVELCTQLRPDVITLDMMLPLMTGLAATEYIMSYCPTPILIVSASINRGELFRTYDALSAGAVDVLDKPLGTEPDGAWEARFVSAVRMVSRIRAITHPRARLGLGSGASGSIPPPREPSGAPFRLVAIGASTGGPAAILELLRALPAPFPIPILATLHIGHPFGAAFADWLDGQTAHRASFARDRALLDDAAGKVILAPPDRHVVVQDGRLRLDEGPERHSCRPSVDVQFESIARSGLPCMAALLTGMGRDGAAGLLAIRNAGGTTIAQDEASSVVFGMPREAILLGGATRVLPISEIGPAIASAVLDPSSRRRT